MESEDIEQILKAAKYKHLSEVTLVSYRDARLDEIGQTLADAHLKLCAICERRLELLKEEAEARASYKVTEADRRFIKNVVRKAGAGSEPSRVEKLFDLYRSHFERFELAWALHFGKRVVRGSRDGDVKWSWKSEDESLEGWLVLEPHQGITVHFSSSELALEGALIRFRLGPFKKDVTLEREGDHVEAQIKIPRRKIAKKMKDISVELVPPTPT